MFNYKRNLFASLIIYLFSSLFAQNLQDLQKMKDEYEKRNRGRTIDSGSSDFQDIDNIRGAPRNAYVFPYSGKEVKDTVDLTEEHFGYNFFTRRDTIAFWENLPATSNYLLGPGDELIISLWGETQLRKTYIISRQGKIYDDKVGLLSLSGKSLEEAKRYLADQFGRVYATLKGSSPSTFIDVSIGELRSINVNFVGEIKYPGVYPVHPFSTVITGLIQAGGVDTTGSLRNILIRRDNQDYARIDLYNYLLNGDLPENIQLRDQDVVVVPARKVTVKIDSAIFRPGKYELKPNETIAELIDYAGGLTSMASSDISLRRILPIGKRNFNKEAIENYYVNFNNIQLFSVQDGDIVIVHKIFSSIKTVEIIGQVKKPGRYSYFSGMELLDLIKMGGGFQDTTFLKSIYLQRADLVRRNPETRYETLLEIDLNNVVNGGGQAKIKLQNLDRFVVHGNRNFYERENVQITGEVNIPGAYPLITDNETLESIIERSGGLTSKALQNGIAIYRHTKYFEDIDVNNFVNPLILSQTREELIINENNLSDKKDDKKDRVRVAWGNMQIALMPGDSIIVKEATNVVNVVGEVYNPGLIEFRGGKSIRYYINSAGGLNQQGNKKGIVIVYANGVVSPKKWYVSPKVKDGSTIIINRKELDGPFDLTQFATNWTSIISSIITTIILSKQISGSG